MGENQLATTVTQNNLTPTEVIWCFPVNLHGRRTGPNIELYGLRGKDKKSSNSL